MGELLDKINELEEELSKLKIEYARSENCCINTECPSFNNKSSLNCRWTDLVGNCKNYIFE